MKKLIYIPIFLFCLFAEAQSNKVEWFLEISRQDGGTSTNYSLGTYSPTWIIVMDSTSLDPTATVDTDPLNSWDDLSGNGNDFTQTSTNRPELDIVGGEKEVNFDDAAAQYFDAPNNSLGELVLGTDEATFIVKEGNITASLGAFFSKSVAGSERNYIMYRSNNVDNTYINIGGSIASYGAGAGVPTGVTDRVWVLTVSTSVYNLYVDGVQVATDVSFDTTYDDHSGQSMNIGGRTDGSFTLNGNMQFFGMAEGVATSGEIAQIFATLQEN